MKYLYNATLPGYGGLDSLSAFQPPKNASCALKVGVVVFSISSAFLCVFIVGQLSDPDRIRRSWY